MVHKQDWGFFEKQKYPYMQWTMVLFSQSIFCANTKNSCETDPFKINEDKRNFYLKIVFIIHDIQTTIFFQT